jgi:hypothetical protein
VLTAAWLTPAADRHALCQHEESSAAKEHLVNHLQKLPNDQRHRLYPLDLLLRPQQLPLEVLLLLLDVLLLRSGGIVTVSSNAVMSAFRPSMCDDVAGRGAAVSDVMLVSRNSHLDVQKLVLPLQRLQPSIQVLVCILICCSLIQLHCIWRVAHLRVVQR